MVLSRVSPAVALCVLVSAADASAQGWLEDRDRAEGSGISAGPLELHPGLGVEGGYDSNVFFEDEGADGSAILRATGHLIIATRDRSRDDDEESGRMVEFESTISASYLHYFLDSISGNAAIDASAEVEINPEGHFRLAIGDRYTRGIRPFVDPGSDSNPPSFVRNRNNASLGVGYFSDGEVFQAELGYANSLDFFKDAAFSSSNNVTHNGSMQLTYNFLPMTGVVHRTEVQSVNYTNTDATSLVVNRDTTILQSVVGLNGVLTPKLTLAILGGYTANYVDGAETSDTDSWMAQLNASYRVSDAVRFAAGFARRYTPSFVGNYSLVHEVSTSGQFMFSGRMMLGYGLSVAKATTGEALLTDGSTVGVDASGNDLRTRDEVRLTGNVFAEYRALDWLGVSLTARYAGNLTDYRFRDQVVDGVAISIPDPSAAYQKVEAWLGVRAFY